MRKIFLITFSAILFLSVGSAIANEAAPLADDPVTEQRLISISEEMRCLVCQNESLAGSRSDLANDLRREIRILIKEGKSDDQIRNFMVERYGDFVLYKPEVKPLTWVLWFGPFLLLVFGIAGMALYLRQRQKEMPVKEQLSDEDRRKVQEILKSGDAS